MTPLADGSDLGGSLRNPASFCGVVGFRPSIGRVPAWPQSQPWTSMSVDGPIARSVRDVALLMSVLAGPDPRSPIAIDEPGSVFRGPLRARFHRGVRIAWSRNLGQVSRRAGRQPGVRRGTPRLHGPGMQRRGRRTGFRRRGRHVSDTARLGVRPGSRRGPQAAPRPDEGHGRLEYGTGAEHCPARTSRRRR